MRKRQAKKIWKRVLAGYYRPSASPNGETTWRLMGSPWWRRRLVKKVDA